MTFDHGQQHHDLNFEMHMNDGSLLPPSLASSFVIMPDKARKFACTWEGCGKLFMRKTDVTRHYRIHLNDRPFKCSWPDCGKAFMQRSAVKIHYRTHTGEKPNMCPFEGCGKSFNDTSSLARHRRTHRYDEPFPCSFRPCPEHFSTRKLLNTHEKEIHGLGKMASSANLHIRETPSPMESLTNSFSYLPQPVGENSAQERHTSISNHLDYLGQSAPFVNSNAHNDLADGYPRSEKRGSDTFSDGYFSRSLNSSHSQSFENSTSFSKRSPHLHPGRFEHRSMSISSVPPLSRSNSMDTIGSTSLLHLHNQHQQNLLSSSMGNNPLLNHQHSYSNHGPNSASIQSEYSYGPQSATMHSNSDNHFLDHSSSLSALLSAGHLSDNGGPHSAPFHHSFNPSPMSAHPLSAHGDYFDQFHHFAASHLPTPDDNIPQPGGIPIRGASFPQNSFEYQHEKNQQRSKPPRINTCFNHHFAEYPNHSVKMEIHHNEQYRQHDEFQRKYSGSGQSLLSPLYVDPPRTADGLTTFFSTISTNDSNLPHQ